jgi:hypothetical protein
VIMECWKISTNKSSHPLADGQAGTERTYGF